MKDDMDKRVAVLIRSCRSNQCHVFTGAHCHDCGMSAAKFCAELEGLLQTLGKELSRAIRFKKWDVRHFDSRIVRTRVEAIRKLAETRPKSAHVAAESLRLDVLKAVVNCRSLTRAKVLAEAALLLPALTPSYE